MRFVDEFRDGALGQKVAAQILGVVEPGRHYKVMEVCGGHTHSIYRYGVDDLLPENVELVHGPGCPVCVIPMGRVDDGIAIAREPGVIFTCFGDMLRVPGSNGTLLDAKAQGADVRMVYSPLDALRIAKAEPDREVVFFAIGFETTAPSTALTLMRARAEGVKNFSCMCNHVTIVPPLRALLESPDLRLDGFIGPGHVSTVVGARPFEFIPADYGRPVVIAGFEPLDILHAIHMILRQLAEGRCEVENQYTRVVPYEGNPRALRRDGRGVRPPAALRVARAGIHLPERAAALGRLRGARRRGALQRARRARGRPQGVPVRRGAQGRHQAVGVQGLRHRLHARARDRHLHGLAGGSVRRLLQLREIRAGKGGRVTVSDREERILGIIETARAKRPRFKDERITMAHGAGGKATQTLIEGLLAPAFGLDELADAAIVGDGIALTTDSFVVKPLRFPGGSIGELAVNGTVNDLAVAGARPLALSLALILEEGLDSAVLRAEVEAMAQAAAAAGVQIVSGDTKVVERGHADGMYVCTTGVGLRDPRAELSPGAARPGDRVLVSGSIGEHGTAIMLARGDLGLDADIESDTCSLWPAVDAMLGPEVHCIRDATRGGVASVLNEIARAAGVAIVVREGDVPVDPAVAGAAELLGIDPMYVANEGKLVAFVAPDAAAEALAALRAVDGCEQAAEIGEVRTEPTGMVLVETAFGGRRVMDQLVGDPLPRIC